MTLAEGTPRPYAVLISCAVAGTSTYGTLFWILRDRGPTPEAIAEATRSIRAEHRSDDLIFLLPHYATRAREHLGDLGALALKNPLAEDFDVHPRAWVFGLFGAAESWRTDFAKAGLKLEKSWTPSLGIVIDLYQTGARYAVTYDFLTHLREAHVFHEKSESTTRCQDWAAVNGQGGAFGRWICPTDRDWFYVGPEWHRMGDHLRLCLWAHPPNEGRLVTSFYDVPLTGTLHGRAGHTLNSSVRARAPVFLDVQVGDNAPTRQVFELSDTYKNFRMVTPTTGTATVSFAVSSPNAGANHFCFTADMRQARAEE